MASEKLPLVGKWRHYKDDNFSNYLKKLGVGFMKRKVVENLHPDVTITEDNGKWSIRTQTSLSDQTVEFTLNEEYQTNVKGLVEGMMKCLSTYEGGKLTSTAEPVDADIKATKQDREVVGEEMVQTMICEDCTCKRFFKRLE